MRQESTARRIPTVLSVTVHHEVAIKTVEGIIHAPGASMQAIA